MHPCCWGNLLQSLAGLVPALAVLAIAGKKMLEALRPSLGALRRKIVSKKKSCCCPSKLTGKIESQI